MIEEKMGESISRKKLRIGDVAPNFTLYDQNDQPFDLYETLKSKFVVLFFYPKDYSPICTLEAIAFRNTYSEFIELGAEVVGISSDSPQSHRNFCTTLKLPFKLLVDEKHKVKDLFHNEGFIDRYMGRTSYVIDHGGTIKGTCESMIIAKKHMKNAIDTVHSLNLKAS